MFFLKIDLELKPSFAQFCQLAKRGNLIPVYSEFLADIQTPVLAAMKLDEGDYSFLLESVEGREKWATYSFLGVNPSLVFSCKGQEVTLKRGKQVSKQTLIGNPLDYLQRFMNEYRPVAVKGVPRFHGGAVGFMSYDCVRYFEEIPGQTQDDYQLPDAVFMLTDTLVVFNNLRHQIQIIANARLPEKPKKKDLEKSYQDAAKRIAQLRAKLLKSSEKPASLGTARAASKAKALFSKKEFVERVKKAKRYVHDGDVVQVVLSNRFQGRTKLRPLQIYRALRALNPSPYLFYLRLKDMFLVGSSPETLVRLEEGLINVRPIAGTRPRGKTDLEDQKLARELLADPKERAEHIMLVDLGRNDVGRVAQGGSVKVTELMSVERYSHVMHLVSNVQAKLKKSCSAFDLLSSTFPAGTLSGAPKVRAMEIIDELEKTRRGPYGGAVGYFSYSGNMDFCITIRTLLLQGENYYMQAGAGIVADSDPVKEYEECQNKARALLRALDLARKIP